MGCSFTTDFPWTLSELQILRFSNDLWMDRTALAHAWSQPFFGVVSGGLSCGIRRNQATPSQQTPTSPTAPGWNKSTGWMQAVPSRAPVTTTLAARW